MEQEKPEFTVTEKPKKAASAYFIFMKEYMSKNKGTRITKVAEIWGQLKPGEKSKYTNLAADENEKYQEKMTEWRKYKAYIEANKPEVPEG